MKCCLTIFLGQVFLSGCGLRAVFRFGALLTLDGSVALCSYSFLWYWWVLLDSWVSVLYPAGIGRSRHCVDPLSVHRGGEGSVRTCSRFGFSSVLQDPKLHPFASSLPHPSWESHSSFLFVFPPEAVHFEEVRLQTAHYFKPLPCGPCSDRPKHVLNIFRWQVDFVFLIVILGQH